MKNYASLYNYSGDSSGLEQRLYAKQEVTRGELVVPANADHFLHIGGSSDFQQPFESSPHKSGRHNNNVIYDKKELSWGYQTFVNIDSGAAAGGASVDNAIQLLWKSLMGQETDTPGTSVVYVPRLPDFTFSIYEVGDIWAKQMRGCFVEANSLAFPGDGRSTMDWSGMGKDELLVGVGKSTVSNNGGNTVTAQVGEGYRFPVGAKVMLIEADGVTRSADTPAGSARTVVSVAGDVVTVDGAVLADADGSVTPIYLSYYEPDAPTAIDDPKTGLEGSVTIASMTVQKCMRNATLTLTNNHDVTNYCFGSDSLDAPFFSATGRFQAELSFETNLNPEVMKLLRNAESFTAEDILLVLGPAAGRRFELDLPKVKTRRPPITVPESGPIPVTFDGLCLQTALDAGDEVTASYK